MTSLNNLSPLDVEGLGLEYLVGEMELTRIIESTQSTCYFFNSGQGSRLVVKRFTNEYVHATLIDASREFEALLSFSKICNSHPHVRTARPLGLLTSGDGYVMEQLEGLGLDEVLEGRQYYRANLADVARQIIEGVKMFHECNSEPYADFHAQNILLDDLGQVGFIDPTIPNRFFYETAEDTPNGFLAADIGYWVFSSAVEFVKQVLFRPRWAFRTIHFTLLLTATSLRSLKKSETSDFFLAVFRATNRHALRLKSSHQVKPFILWLALLPVLRIIRCLCQRGQTSEIKMQEVDQIHSCD